MKAWWEKQSARIDALSLRERMFLFFSLMVCMLAIGDVVWLTPAQNAERQVAQRFDAQTAELARLRQDLQNTSKPSDASIALRDELASLQSRIDGVNRALEVSAPSSANGPALEQVLMQFLRRQEGLTLLGTRTLQGAEPPVVRGPAEAMLAGQQTLATARTAPESGAPASTAATAATAAVLSRKGLELRVAGPYAELVRYVKTLETALPNLRWGPMVLKSDKQVPELTLQVYLVGVQP